MGVGLEAAVVYQAVKFFVLVSGVATILIVIGLWSAGRLSRWTFPILLWPGVVLALTLGLYATEAYELKGTWATLHNGWVRPEHGGVMDRGNPVLVAQARRVHRASTLACASVAGLALIALSLRNRRKQPAD